MEKFRGSGGAVLLAGLEDGVLEGGGWGWGRGWRGLDVALSTSDLSGKTLY